jgi:hypothetical protein
LRSCCRERLGWADGRIPPEVIAPVPDAGGIMEFPTGDVGTEVAPVREELPVKLPATELTMNSEKLHPPVPRRTPAIRPPARIEVIFFLAAMTKPSENSLIFFY